MAALLLVFAVVAGIGCAVVLAVYRRGDLERVARECAHKAVSMEREQVQRMLIANATALRRSGRRAHAQTVDQLVGLLKSRPIELKVDVTAFTRAKAAKGSTQKLLEEAVPS